MELGGEPPQATPTRGASAKRRWSIAALIVGVCAITIVAFCGGEEPPIVWEDEPAYRRWPVVIWATAEGVAERNADQSDSIRAEREWCMRNAAELPAEVTPATIFDPASADQLAHLTEPLDDDTRNWMAQVIDEVERRRGVELDRQPQIRIFRLNTWRRLSCRQLVATEPTAQPPPDWVLGQLLGYLEPDWTPAIRQHLYRLWAGGVYHSAESGHLITLIGNVPLDRQSVPVFSHEAVHALQNQLIGGGLSRIYDARSTDQRNALRAVVEGDAEAASLSLADPFLSRIIASHRWSGTPSTIYALPVVTFGILGLSGTSAIDPYEEGHAFIREIERKAGWAGVNELLHDPPDSSEQVLHRDKLLVDEQPAPIEPLLQMRDDVLRGSGGDDLSVDTLGEAIIADLIRFTTQQPALSREAAAGWAVDVISAASEFDGEPATIVVWQIAFDDSEEHAQGIRGLREWLIAASSGEAVAGRNGRATAWNGPAGAIRVANNAGLVWIVASNEQRIADELTARIFELKERWSPPNAGE